MEKVKENKVRDYRMDNIKAMLIILVVVGHLLELFLKSGNVKTIYKIIYSFHMPLFIFISGYFARFNLKKIFAGIIAPYIVFQTIYILYVNYILTPVKDVKFTYAQPYWLMWYMMAMAVWSIALPLISYGGKKLQISLFIISLVVSIAVGYVHEIGMKYTLSRIFVYFPFFILGHHFSGLMKDEEKREKLKAFYHDHKMLISMTSAAAFGAAMGLIMGYTKKVSYVWFYECAPYTVSHEPAEVRIAHFLVAVICIIYFYLLIPNIKFNFMSKLGAKTKGVYLLHGFVILALKDMVGLI